MNHSDLPAIKMDFKGQLLFHKPKGQSAKVYTEWPLTKGKCKYMAPEVSGAYPHSTHLGWGGCIKSISLVHTFVQSGGQLWCRMKGIWV